MYGRQSSNNHPPGSHHNHPGPPQPEWRSSKPAKNTQTAQSWNSPLPPPPPPPLPASASYNPSTYGHMPGTVPVTSAATRLSPVSSGVDTSKWGVRYNQQQQPPPPLPPRRSSPGNLSQTPGQPSPGGPPGPGSSPRNTSQTNNQLPATNITETYQQPWTATTVQGTSSPPVPPPPPPPPPIPLGYQTELQHAAQTWQQQQQQHPPYSERPSIHHYDLPAQSQTVQIPSYPQSQDYGHSHAMTVQTSLQNPAPDTHKPMSPSLDRPLPPLPTEIATGLNSTSPVSVQQPTSGSGSQPITNVSSAGIGPSALGGGAPSDWEHFSRIPGGVDDTEVFYPKKTDMQQPSSTVELPSNPSATVPDRVLVDQVIDRKSANHSPIQYNANVPHRIPRKPSPIAFTSAQSQRAPNTSPPVHTPRVDSIGSPTSNISADEDDASKVMAEPVSSETQFQRDSQHPPVTQPTTVEQKATGEAESVEARKEAPAPPPTQPKDDVTKPTLNPDVPAVQKKIPDPYENLDPWFQSSLARYVTMLRKEAVAESDEEKYKVFTAFVAKETKLREILYSIEPSSGEDAGSVRSSQGGQIPRTKSADPSLRVDSGLIPLHGDERPRIVRFATAPPEDVSDQGGEGAYSPGGRPILSPHAASEAEGNEQKLRRSASHSGSSAFGASATYHDGHQPPRSTSVPPASINNPWRAGTETPLISNPPQPIYTPFRYTEGPQRGSDNLIFDRPAYQAYSALRQAVADSGRAMSHTPKPTSRGRAGTLGSSAAHEHDETFLGLIREKSLTYRKKRHDSMPPVPLLPDGIRQSKFDIVLEELSSLTPDPFPEKKESSFITATRKDIEEYSDDFRYIKETIEEWERSAKDRRQKLDKERMVRQEESESHIDALFNNNEIGYSDINTLEDDFRHAEAKTQLEEERQELEKFIAEAYNPLDERLKDEIFKLRSHYKLTVDELDAPSSGDKESTSNKYQVSHIMRLLNDIYQKLELRYQKRLDIALDRERRRKKAERRPLIFMGDSPALKKLDGEFDSMERRNILEASNDRDERANMLMDSFDKAIMRGLGENQSLLDRISVRVKKLDPKAITLASLSPPDIESILRSTYALVKFLEADNESILRSFGSADSLLNEADYSVSVAEARYSNADGDIFRRLDDEKKKEDAKIEQQLSSKLESVRKGPSEVTAKIDSLLEALGKEGGPGTGPWGRLRIENTAEIHRAEVLMPGPRPTSAAPSRSDADLGQQERLRKALEDAKRRNAARQQH